jgi:enoyl-CoA hydratase/carnithine racemase
VLPSIFVLFSAPLTLARAARGVTKLGLPECTLGVIPGAGGTQRAPRVVGRARAMELIFTGRAVDAREALQMGPCACAFSPRRCCA